MTRARDLADLGGSANAGTVTGESLIINGDMAVAQRATSATSSGYSSVDRYRVDSPNRDQLAYTQSQSTTVPSGQGFSNSFKIEVTTAETTVDSDEYLSFSQRIEGQNLQHLNYGNSSAKSLTLSFWVRSSLTGKYSVNVYAPDGTRVNTLSFNISTADTFEYKTIQIDGDTAGTINDDNGAGLNLNFVLAAGSSYSSTITSGWQAYTNAKYAHSDQVNFAAQTGTFYITGLKLEVGSTATPFKHESYAENELKCKRYYQKIADRDVAPVANAATISRFVFNAYSTINAALQHHFEVEMRDAPTVTYLACSILNNTKTANWYDGAWRGADASSSNIYSNAVHIELANPTVNFDGDYGAYIGQLNFVMNAEL